MTQSQNDLADAAARCALPLPPLTQQIHLLPVLSSSGSHSVAAPPAKVQPPLPLPQCSAFLALEEEGPRLLFGQASPGARGTQVEPFLNRHKQLRLFVAFHSATAAFVNGVPAGRSVVLRERDVFQFAPSVAFRVAVFHKPQLGPPPPATLGKLCPICRVPFVADATCYTCACGVLLHCEADEKEGLQCAQMRRECPRCNRPILLTEGYVNPPNHED